MKGWFWHRTKVLLVALLLGLGTSVPPVQGEVLAAEMVVAADGAHQASSGCDGCGGGDHKGMNAGTCLPVCASAAHGLTAGELLPPYPASRMTLQPADLSASGQSHNPDHGPPKILTLG